MLRYFFTRRLVLVAGLALSLSIGATIASAQTVADDDDAVQDLAEPDFALVNLPTTLRLPVHGGDFHLSHRFNENLRQDGFGDQISNLFGLDQGANIGLEFRFGVMRHLQAIVARTNLSRAIQFSAKYDGWHQNGHLPVSVSALVSLEGDNNFRQNYAPAVGLIVSRTFAQRVAIYADPVFVRNTATGGLTTRNTALVGLGTSLRLGKTVYLIGEVTPRAGGFTIGDPAYAVAIEKRVGAHTFSLTIANGAQSTFRQLAHGGVPQGLYLGFNLSRKFY
jgi:hypothetical protein